MRILTLIAAVSAIAGQCNADSFHRMGQRDAVTAATTCTTTLKKPTPTASICGVGGTLSNSDPIEIPFQAVPTAGFSASDVCRNACINKSKPACLSFSFVKSDQACSLFGKSISNQGFQSSSSEHNTLYYDEGCFHSKCHALPPTPSTVTVTVTTTVAAVPTDDVFRFSFGYDLLSIAGGTVTVNSTFQQTSIAVDGSWVWNLQFGPDGGSAVYETDMYTIVPNTEYNATVYCYAYSGTSCTLTMYAYDQADNILATGSTQSCGSEEFQDISVSFNTGTGTSVFAKYIFRCNEGQGPNGIGPEIAVDAVSLRPA